MAYTASNSKKLTVTQGIIIDYRYLLNSIMFNSEDKRRKKAWLKLHLRSYVNYALHCTGFNTSQKFTTALYSGFPLPNVTKIGQKVWKLWV